VEAVEAPQTWGDPQAGRRGVARRFHRALVTLSQTVHRVDLASTQETAQASGPSRRHRGFIPFQIPRPRFDGHSRATYVGSKLNRGGKCAPSIRGDRAEITTSLQTAVAGALTKTGLTKRATCPTFRCPQPRRQGREEPPGQGTEGSRRCVIQKPSITPCHPLQVA